MALGGARPGAGRKPGAKNKRTAEIARKASEKGITPLEVMLEAMWKVYKVSGAEAAVPYAKECAIYIHPKIQSIEMSGKDGGPMTIKLIKEIVDPSNNSIT